MPFWYTMYILKQLYGHLIDYNDQKQQNLEPAIKISPFLAS